MHSHKSCTRNKSNKCVKNQPSYHFVFVVLMFLVVANSVLLPNSSRAVVLSPPSTGRDVSQPSDALTKGSVCEGLSDAALICCMTDAHTHFFH